MGDETVTARRMRGLELTSAWLGEGNDVLMERAGEGVAAYIRSAFPALEPARLAVACGRGNNGGDGYAVARHFPGCRVLSLGEPATPEARAALARLGARPVLVPPVPDLGGFDVIVDAILGTGVAGEVRPPASDLIEAMNASDAAIVSVDVPSGVDPDTGEHGAAYVHADHTVALHAPKRGSAGQVHVHPIFSADALATCGPGDVYALPPRRREAHKGESGIVLIIGGSEDYVGAPGLAGLGALRAGADLVFIAAPERVAWVINRYSPDIITAKGLEPKRLEPLIARADVVLAGPGLTDKGSWRAVDLVLEHASVPLVIDASAIGYIKEREDLLKGRTVLLTPHRGEFRALAGEEPTAEAASDYSRRTGACVLLKGPEDIVVWGDRLKRNRTGNPGMTVGGTGDVLAGVAAAYLALCKDPFDAACAAAYVVGAAGDLAFAEHGEGLIASDLPPLVAKVMKGCREL